MVPSDHRNIGRLVMILVGVTVSLSLMNSSKCASRFVQVEMMHDNVGSLSNLKEIHRQRSEKSTRQAPAGSKPGDIYFTDATTSPHFAVFYNIFIPDDEEKAQNALRIVQEQINQVGESYVASLGPNKTATLFYNTIGKPDTLTATYMQQLCGQHNLICKHMSHYESGFEEVTLQPLHEFCSIHDDYRVAYIHNKGSYHEHGDKRNEYWRRHGTLAATSKSCLKPANETCNLCGMQFWAYWTFFMPGNFWTAKCTYIKQLIPPLQFQDRINQVTMKVLFLQLQNKFTVNLYSGKIDHYGIERFASEHWVGSHPSVIPCDVGGHKDFWYWLSGDRGSEQFDWAMGPRKDGSPIDRRRGRQQREKVLADERLRTKEYFLLAGRLFKWYELYNQVPPSNSWIWDWFPDGHRWKQAVDKFGNKTVELVTSGLATLPRAQ